MSHIITYIKYKAGQFKSWSRRHYEYPMFLTWVFIIIGSVFVQQGMNLHAIVAFGFAVLYYCYCDYKTGDDVGWYRNKLKEKARKED